MVVQLSSYEDISAVRDRLLEALDALHSLDTLHSPIIVTIAGREGVIKNVRGHLEYDVTSAVDELQTLGVQTDIKETKETYIPLPRI
jgi:hypothetical protein